MEYCAVTCLNDWHDPTCRVAHGTAAATENPAVLRNVWTGADGLTRFTSGESTQPTLFIVR